MGNKKNPVENGPRPGEIGKERVSQVGEGGSGADFRREKNFFQGAATKLSGFVEGSREVPKMQKPDRGSVPSERWERKKLRRGLRDFPAGRNPRVPEVTKKFFPRGGHEASRVHRTEKGDSENARTGARGLSVGEPGGSEGVSEGGPGLGNFSRTGGPGTWENFPKKKRGLGLRNFSGGSGDLEIFFEARGLRDFSREKRVLGLRKILGPGT
jgi:hypothetical protein